MRLTPDFSAKPEYSEAYVNLHKKFGVPLHGLTPEQTRFFHYAFRNEVNVFFRTCDLTGDEIISQYPSDSPYKIYRHDLWWTKEFTVPEADYDPNKSFFQQFHKLQLQTPRMGTECGSSMENCPYVNSANHCKDCHMIFAAGDNEDCLYCINLERSQTTMDASIAHECILCYGIVSCRKCYNVDFSVYAVECADCKFLYDCRRCKNCFMCVGLVGKEYCILNQQYTKETYEKEIEAVFPLTPERVRQCFERMDSLRNAYVHKYANILASENCTGNDISFSQNCLNNYITEYSQDCINGSSLRRCKDCLDFDLWGDPGELCYHTMSCGYHVYGLKMCFECWNNCRFLTYCDSCPSCEYCFGCVGLKGRKYCILNKQYSPAEYKKLEERIIADMQRNREWGQFFPPYCSSHALNNSMCHEYFNIDKPLADKLGFSWMDKSSEYQYNPKMVYTGSMISLDVQYEDLKGKVLLCNKTGRPFDIQKRELQILQQKKLPLPDRHWRVRMEERAEKFIFPWQLHQRQTVDTQRTVDSPVPDKYQIREKALE